MISNNYRPRRSALYIPCHQQRFIHKARTLNADSLIFDLQESVPPALKAQALSTLIDELADSDFGYSERVVRVNRLDSPWFKDDITKVASLDIDAVLFPNINSKHELLTAINALDEAGGQDKSVMVNIESALGVLRVEEIASCSERLTTLIMGTSDLANALHINATLDRQGLQTYLSMCLLAARAYDKSIIDGPHFDLKDAVACEYSCRQARDFGFDGKAVIHPVQLTYTNDAMTPKQEDVNRAKAIIKAMENAHQQNRSVGVVDGRVIEPCLQDWAERVLCLCDMVKRIGQSELLGPTTR
ncbi:CoA ester lyase [Thalassotalea ponticola]|uniref:HpcH/HpaI aldolase/citrate lyase family protein n=1 Tax=Thalassotalea ponticola TaxID=1523392 RepID=UPI0025B36883|nr:CoA ester lyase [Thalassotalea ponticola]MDN3651237.1 CoA ester lyase [Thalassotalea ponticola]